jgi:ketosteroid isomerase-like protein
MSQENVEVVRGAFAAFERDGLAGMLPHFDSEIEWTTTDGYTDPATYRKSGQTVRLHSEYNSTHAADDVMGIMLMYIDP